VRKDKRKEGWLVKIDNKPLQGYFTEIFNFNKGKKKPNYDFPKLIKSSDFKLRKACAIGVMIYDGVVRTKKEIGLNIGSKNLRDSVFNVLVADGLNITKLDKPDSTGMWKLYSSGKADKEQYKKGLNYFVKFSDKWYRIYEWIHGFRSKVKNPKNALIILERCFNKRSASKVTLTEIFKLFLLHKNLTISQLSNLLKIKNIIVNEGLLWDYTKILREMNILIKRRLSDNKNLYVYNPDTKSWKLPYRPYLSSYYV